MKFEIIKIFKKRKGFLFLLVFCIIKCIEVNISGYDSHYIINQDVQGYSSYMKQYSGKLTDAVEQSILQEYDVQKRAEAKMSELYDLMKEKKISKEEYMSQSKQYLEGQKNGFVFQIIYSKYTYAKMDGERHYMIDSRGWETLLTHGNLDYILAFAILILIAPIFTYEYECRMDSILNTCKKGKVQSAVWKLGISVLIAVLVTCLFQSISYLYLNSTVGLPHGNYPIQSLPFYEKSTYRMTIVEVYAITLLCKILGSVLMAMMVSLIAIVCKKTIITLIAGSGIVILPALIFPSESIRYYLPFPTGLMTANGYLWPSRFEIRTNEKGSSYRYYLFHEITSKQTVILLIIFAIEIAILLIACIRRFSNLSFAKGLKKMACVLLLPLLFFFTGCSKESYKDNFVFSEEYDRMQAVYKDEEITLDYGTNRILIRDGTEDENLIRDVFPDDFKVVSICVKGDDCYYLSKDIYNNDLRVYQINLRNLDRKIVYNSIPENKEDFFGLITQNVTENDIFDSLEQVRSFFVTNNALYLRIGSRIEKINLKNKERKVILTNLGEENYCYVRGKLYYVETSHRLCYYDTETKDQGYIGEVFTDYIEAQDNELLYSDIFDNKVMKKLLE